MQSPFIAPKTLNKSLAQISGAIFTGDGSFLNNESISKYLVEAPDRSLTFKFNRCNLFRRFTKSDPTRAKIVQRFVDTLVNHPKASDITHLNMAPLAGISSSFTSSVVASFAVVVVEFTAAANP
jgi:hypothetical protein